MMHVDGNYENTYKVIIPDTDTLKGMKLNTRVRVKKGLNKNPLC